MGPAMRDQRVIAPASRHISLTYVKAHQDDHTPYAQLPFLAQLNVDADHQASKYQTQFGAHRMSALLSPNARMLVHSLEGTITGRYETILRARSTSPAIKKYIQDRNHWTEQVMETVNWKAHKSALKAYPQRRIHLSKLVHDCLPTHAQANRFDAGHRTYPVCDCTTEDRDHILRCPSQSRSLWRDNFWVAIEEFHATRDTYPILRTIFREAIAEWFQGNEEGTSTIFYPVEATQLIHQQNQLGWRQIFSGRFSKEWCRIQDDYYQRSGHRNNRNNTGERWQVHFQKIIWEQWFALWKTRNGEVHRIDSQTRYRAARIAINQELETIHVNRVHMEPEVQQLIPQELEEQQQRPAWTNRNWLAMNRPIFRESIRRVRVASTRGVRSIRTYFQSH